MSKFILISPANANLILDWQDGELFSYGVPGEGQECLPITEAQWEKRDDGKAQGFYAGNVQDWQAPPSDIPEGKAAVWNGAEWVLEDAPLPPPPFVITMRQARLALHAAGLLNSAEAVINLMQGDVGGRARIEWEYAQEVQRSNPLIAVIAQQMELTETQIDDLFRQGALL